MKKTKKSIDGNANNNINNKSKEKIKNDKNDKDSESAIEKEIDKLKEQVKNLIEMNDALVKRLEKIVDKKYENKIDPKNILSFVQKYEGKFRDIDSKLKDEKEALSFNLNKKEKSLKNLFENTNLNFKEIKSRVKNLNEKITEIKEKQIEKEEALKTGFEGDKLTIENDLNVKGVTYSKKVETKQINIENLEIKDNVLKVVENTRLVIGSESFNFSEVSRLLKYVNTIQAHCGDNFEFCKVVPVEKKNEIEEKQMHIVENLKKLRSDSTHFFDKHGLKDKRKERFFRR